MIAKSVASSISKQIAASVGVSGDVSVGGLLTAGLVTRYAFDEGSGNVAFNKIAASQVSPFSLVAAPEQNFATKNGTIWTVANLTITDDYAANPVDGKITASRAVSTGDTRYLFQGNLTLPAGQYTVSLMARSNNGSTQKISFALNCGGFLTSPDYDVTTSWTRISHTFTITGGAGEVYILNYSTPRTAIDLVFYDVRIDAGVSVLSPSAPTDWHMELGIEMNASADATKPTWSSAGLQFASGGQQTAFGVGDHNFDAVTAYVVCKRSGTPYFANYLPLMSSNGTSSDNPAFHLAGMHNSFFPYFRWGAPANFVEAYGATLEDGLVHVLAGRYDGDYLRIYLDGVEVERKQIGLISTFNLNRMFISNFGFANYWAGDIYYSLMYDVAHTKEQIASQTAVLRQLMAERSVTVATIDNFVIFEGDSIASPRTSPTGEKMYPYKALNAISPRPQGRNFAVPGSIIADIGPGVASLVRREEEVKASFVPGIRNIFFMADGHNDANSGTFQSDYSGYIGRLRSYATANGIDLRIICATILPDANATLQAAINIQNPWIIANYLSFGANALCRFDLAPNMSDPTNLTYYADGTHPTAVGHDQMFPVAKAAIEAQLV